MSRPLRARGLKPLRQDMEDWTSQVAPLAGAWIETYTAIGRDAELWSRPLRARGLKKTHIDGGCVKTKKIAILQSVTN